MTTLDIDKAQSSRGEHVPNLTIMIARPVRSYSDVSETGQHFDRQGRMLAIELHKVLPGGTFDSLLGHLHRIRSSQLVVSLAGLEKPDLNPARAIAACQALVDFFEVHPARHDLKRVYTEACAALGREPKETIP